MPLLDSALTHNSSVASLGVPTARQYSTRHGPSQGPTGAMRQSDFGMSHRARAAHFLAASSYKGPATGLGSPQVRLQPLCFTSHVGIEQRP
jgi:hypothetical protein